jgi:hypothetical protein
MPLDLSFLYETLSCLVINLFHRKVESDLLTPGCPTPALTAQLVPADCPPAFQLLSPQPCTSSFPLPSCGELPLLLSHQDRAPCSGAPPSPLQLHWQLCNPSEECEQSDPFCFPTQPLLVSQAPPFPPPIFPTAQQFF